MLKFLGSYYTLKIAYQNVGFHVYEMPFSVAPHKLFMRMRIECFEDKCVRGGEEIMREKEKERPTESEREIDKEEE